MNHRVDIAYNTEPSEMLEWCERHLDGPFEIGQTGGWEGPGWRIFHTTTNVIPYYIITRGVFEREEDAMLFGLRWS